jgi:hypothetical protein
MIPLLNMRFSEKLIIQLLIFFGSIACLFFGISELGFNENIVRAKHGSVYSRYCDIFYYIFVRTKDYLYRLGHVFIIEFNVINVLIIYLSNYESKFSYQYIVFFLVSSWFFEQKLSFWINIFLNVTCVAIIFFIGEDYSQKEEFLLTFFCSYSRSCITNAKENQKRNTTEGK